MRKRASYVLRQATDARPAEAGGPAAWMSRTTRRDGRPLHIAAQDQSLLDQVQARFHAALAHIVQGVAIFDASERLVIANRRYCEQQGLSHNDLRPGVPLWDIIQRGKALGRFPGMSVADVYAFRMQSVCTRTSTVLIEEPRPGVTLRIGLDPLPDGGWMVTIEDISEHRRAEKQVAFLAGHDPLTGLPNRAVLRDRLEQDLANASRGRRFALMLLNLDRFKGVNDLLGHPSGDRLLQLAGARLQACVREVDLVARLSGDEFALVIAEPTLPGSAGQVAERIIAAFGMPFDLNVPSSDARSFDVPDLDVPDLDVPGLDAPDLDAPEPDMSDRAAQVQRGSLNPRRVTTGASIGIVLAPGDGTTPDALLRHADTALRRAKADHRGTARFFEPGMDATHLARRMSENDLRLALERSEFELFYQPLISLRTGAVIAFEALMRWRHPVHGLVPPLDFIPLLEETGLIVAVGAWAVYQACHDAAAWPERIGVAVNLSAVQFRNPGLVDSVQAALQSSGLAASRLELEITESVLLHNTEGTVAALHTLRAIGIRIAMDDFGTGYSSLSYLNSFPFDKIKIDRSFVQDAGGRASARAIVRAIASLGASLGIATTAEGVETAAQMAALRRDGCTEAQGYLISRPVPVSQVGAILAARATLDADAEDVVIMSA